MSEVSLDKKKQLAERLYVQTDLTQKQIAEDLKVSEKTMSKWAKDGNWAQLRAASTTGTANLITALLEENQAIADEARDAKRRMTSKEADIINKNANTIEKLEKKVSLVMNIEVFTNYNKWLVELNPKLAGDNTEWQRKYLATLTK
jgi:uncharacterized protein YjcR